MRAIGVGIDLVQVSRISESVDRFGDRFLRRVFTTAEIAYATAAPACRDERLAARFAAKEATIKALGLAAHPTRLREIEVVRADSGACTIALHGETRAAARESGLMATGLSLTHEGDYAAAIVIAGPAAS